MMKTWRTLAAIAALSTVVLVTAGPAHAQNCVPGIQEAFQKHPEVYTMLANALGPDKTVNENHNSRLAIFDAQQYPCGWGLETKFSTSDDQTESYVATRLGDHLDSNGTARISTKQ